MLGLQVIVSETRNNVAGAIGAANDIIASRRPPQSYEKAPFAQLLPPRTRETVRLESEQDQALLERRKPNPGPLGALFDNVLKPKPIVDGLKEEEKYGNNGDKFIGVGRALVNGVEGLSNLFTAAIEVSMSIANIVF